MILLKEQILKNYVSILISVIAIFGSGCAMLPYNEEFACTGEKKHDGSCERVSVNYHQSKENRLSTYDLYKKSKKSSIDSNSTNYRSVIVLGNGVVLNR